MTVVGNPAATVKTSSPGLRARSPNFELVNAVKASKLADDPELTIDAWRMPTVLAKRLSNCSVYGPEVSQKSKLAFLAI